MSISGEDTGDPSIDSQAAHCEDTLQDEFPLEMGGIGEHGPHLGDTSSFCGVEIVNGLEEASEVKRSPVSGWRHIREAKVKSRMKTHLLQLLIDILVGHLLVSDTQLPTCSSRNDIKGFL